MWTIRQEQTDAFRQHHLQKFEDQMVVHLEKFAPRHWQVIGEPTGREVIRLGIEQAKKYGFTNRGPVRFYLELMFMFGSYFDTDPQYPWVQAVLRDPEPMDQMVRADRLFDALNDYIAQVTGPKHENVIEALKRLSRTKVEEVAKPGIPLDESAARELQTIYPQTCEYLGEPAVKRLIRHSFELARVYGFDTTHGRLLMVGLTFFMGHNFPKDPLCAWIGRRLDAKRRPDPAARTEELYAKATLYMKHVLAESAKG
jgi:hypothetical protein